MIVKTFVQTPFQQNTRIVWCEATRAAMCIDPGEASPQVTAYIRENELELKAIVLTHGHLDHIGGTRFLHEEFPNAEVIAHEDEAELYYSLPTQGLLLGMPQQQLAALGMDYDDPPKITRFVADGETLKVGDLRFTIRHCPGHTLGHIVLIEEGEKTVLTGDCLFSGSIGRTDFPGGDYATLIDSIQTKIMSLPDDFTVMCGHGPDTTIGRERLANPFLNDTYKNARGRFV